MSKKSRELEIRPSNLQCRYLGSWWTFLGKISEEELVFLGRQPLLQIHEAWIRVLSDIRGAVLRCMLRIQDDKRAIIEMESKDTNCKDRKISQLQSDIRAKEKRLEEFRSEVYHCERILQYIEELAARAEDKPAIPQLRTKAWLKCMPADSLRNVIAEREARELFMWCVPEDLFCDVIPEEENRAYLVKYLWTTQDNHVVLEMQEEVTSLARDGGKIQCNDFRSPLLLRKWEYDYLREHADFRACWWQYFDSLGTPRGWSEYTYNDGVRTWGEILSK